MGAGSGFDDEAMERFEVCAYVLLLPKFGKELTVGDVIGELSSTTPIDTDIGIAPVDESAFLC